MVMGKTLVWLVLFLAGFFGFHSNVVTAVSDLVLYPTKDAYVREDSPGSNYGNSAALEVDGSPVKISYLEYDLGLIQEGVLSAKIRLRITNSSSSIQIVRSVSSTSWSESGITYDNRPTLGSQVTTINGGKSGTWIEIDITDLVTSNTGKVMSIGIDSAGGDGLDFYSKEATTYKPKLVIRLAGELQCTDVDSDGYSIEGGLCGVVDCNDSNSGINPSVSDICGNGIDENCDGVDVSCSGGAYRAFTDDSYWNKPIPYNATIDSNSDFYIQDALNTSVSSPTYLRLTGAVDHSSAENWAYPIYWVKAGDPEYTIDPRLYGSTIIARIPLGATPQGGSDGALIVYDLERDQVIELYQAEYDSSKDTWSAGSTKIYILSSNGLSKRVSGSNSTINDGHRGIPPSSRAIRIDEVESGSINRRLECFWHDTGRPDDSTPWYYWPMSGYEKDKGGITPEGLVMRIKPEVDINNKGLTPAALVIAKALQEYGCVIGDNDGGTRNSLKLELGRSRWAEIDPDLSLNGLSSLTFDLFEFIEGGYDPEYSGSSPTPTPSPEPLQGDVDGDGDVDVDDYNVVVADFDTSGSPADLNGNGVVDIFDYNYVVGDYGKTL